MQTFQFIVQDHVWHSVVMSLYPFESESFLVYIVYDLNF